MKCLAPNRHQLSQIKAMYKKGAKAKDIATILNIHFKAVDNHCKQFKKDGVKIDAQPTEEVEKPKAKGTAKPGLPPGVKE